MPALLQSWGFLGPEPTLQKPCPQPELCSVLATLPPFWVMTFSSEHQRIMGLSHLPWAVSSALHHFDVFVPFLGFLFQSRASAWIQEYQQVTGQAAAKLIFFEKKRWVGMEHCKIKI